MTGPNGQAEHAALVAQWRDASRRLRLAATAAHDAADAIVSHGVRPGMAQQVYDCAADLRDLSRDLALIERQRDNRDDARKD